MADQSPALETDWVRDIHSFWFVEMDPAHWFRPPAEIDTRIRERFAASLDAIATGMDVEAATGTATRAVATVLLLDQVPRNIFRGTAQAFATDPLALAVARSATSKGLDQTLSKNERLFLYLPFEHSEAPSDQQRAVELIGNLADAELTKFAEAHRNIIARFGRFPHRNAALGRTSTPEELDFLAQPGSSF